MIDYTIAFRPNCVYVEKTKEAVNRYIIDLIGTQTNDLELIYQHKICKTERKLEDYTLSFSDQNWASTEKRITKVIKGKHRRLQVCQLK